MSLGRELPFDAGATVGSNDSGVARSRWQDEAVAGSHRHATVGENELDRAASAVKDFGVSVLVLAVRVARCVRPPVDVTSFAAKRGLYGRGIGRSRIAVPTVLGRDH
jgi:hypothetical protein